MDVSLADLASALARRLRDHFDIVGEAPPPDPKTTAGFERVTRCIRDLQEALKCPGEIEAKTTAESSEPTEPAARLELIIEAVPKGAPWPPADRDHSPHPTKAEAAYRLGCTLASIAHHFGELPRADMEEIWRKGGLSWKQPATAEDGLAIDISKIPPLPRNLIHSLEWCAEQLHESSVASEQSTDEKAKPAGKPGQRASAAVMDSIAALEQRFQEAAIEFPNVASVLVLSPEGERGPKTDDVLAAILPDCLLFQIPATSDEPGHRFRLGRSAQLTACQFDSLPEDFYSIDAATRNRWCRAAERQAPVVEARLRELAGLANELVDTMGAELPPAVRRLGNREARWLLTVHDLADVERHAPPDTRMEWESIRNVFGASATALLRLFLRSPKRTPADSAAKPSKEAIAIALLVDHPDWPDKKIAEHVPCNVKSLYRFPEFKKAKAVLKGGREQIPRGQKVDGRLEAFEENRD